MENNSPTSTIENYEEEKNLDINTNIQFNRSLHIPNVGIMKPGP